MGKSRTQRQAAGAPRHAALAQRSPEWFAAVGLSGAGRRREGAKGEG